MEKHQGAVSPVTEYAPVQPPEWLTMSPLRLTWNEADYHKMKEWLPPTATSILDIGCGFGIIDHHLARHYGGVDLDIHLMDGDEQIRPVGKEQTGYNVKTKAWYDRSPAVRWLQEEFPECRVHGHPPDPSLTIPCDLIISRRSWGHHYPISTYIELAKRSLRPGSRIIVDLRTGRDGLSTLEAHGFRRLSESLELRSYKCQRFAFVR